MHWTCVAPICPFALRQGPAELDGERGEINLATFLWILIRFGFRHFHRHLSAGMQKLRILDSSAFSLPLERRLS